MPGTGLSVTMHKYIFIFFLMLSSLGVSAGPTSDIRLPDMGDSAGSLVSPQEEYRIGQAFFWRLQQQVDLVQDAEINSYIRSLGHRLAANSDAPGLRYSFFVVPDDSINAFAAPGGFIGIHSGLMITAETEDEVASVVAHEIAHITQRHILRRFEQQKRMSLPMTIAMVAGALLGAYDPSMGQAAMMAVQAGGIQMQLDFSRSNESEADNLGMQMLVKSGFDPQAMPSFFERLQQASRYYGGADVPEFLRTHPVTTSRIADARGRAERYTQITQLRDTLRFYLMREKLRVMTAGNLSELLRYYQNRLDDGDGNPDVARYGYVRALMADNNHNRAREELRPLLEEDADRLAYQLTRADIEIATGNTEAALDIYEDFQKIYPDDMALTINQVGALLRVDRSREAVTLLQRQIDVGETAPEIYRLLARAREQMGQKGQSHAAMAEYYYLSGRLEMAADQLRIAADHTRGDEFELAKITSRLRQIEETIKLMDER